MKFTEGLGRYMAAGRRSRQSGTSLRDDAVSASFRVGILGSSSESHLPPAPEVENDPDWVDPGLVEHTMPQERPHPKAQWDDAEGRWIIWDKAANAWVPVLE